MKEKEDFPVFDEFGNIVEEIQKEQEGVTYKQPPRVKGIVEIPPPDEIQYKGSGWSEIGRVGERLIKAGKELIGKSLNEDKIQKFDDVHIKSQNLTGMVYAIKGNDVVVKTLKKGLVKAKLDDLKKIYSDSVEKKFNLFMEENEPTDPGKWSYYKSQAKKKFDVYPSAYANGWAAKQYKAAGGGWKKKK